MRATELLHSLLYTRIKEAMGFCTSTATLVIICLKTPFISVKLISVLRSDNYVERLLMKVARHGQDSNSCFQGCELTFPTIVEISLTMRWSIDIDPLVVLHAQPKLVTKQGFNIII